MSSTNSDTPLLAEKYDRISDIQFDNGLILIEKLGVKKGNRVMDIGCGTGRLAHYVSNIVGSGGKVVGIDPLKLRIEIARKKATAKNITFETGASDDLSFFTDSSFDYVYLNSVLHWIVNKEATLAEVYRVLKPDGQLGLTTHARGDCCSKQVTDRVLSRKPYANSVVLSEDPMIKYAVTGPELKELLAASGFRNISLDSRKTTSYYQSPDEIIDLVTSSSFGNFLLHVPAHLRERAAAEVAAELEKGRNEKGIEFINNTVFATARK